MVLCFCLVPKDTLEQQHPSPKGIQYILCRLTWDPQSNISFYFSPPQPLSTHTSPLIVYFPIQRRPNKHDLNPAMPSYHTYPPHIKSNKMRNEAFQLLDCTPHMSTVSTQLHTTQVTNSRAVECWMTARRVFLPYNIIVIGSGANIAKQTIAVSPWRGSQCKDGGRGARIINANLAAWNQSTRN